MAFNGSGKNTTVIVDVFHNALVQRDCSIRQSIKLSSTITRAASVLRSDFLYQLIHRKLPASVRDCKNTSSPQQLEILPHVGTKKNSKFVKIVKSV